MYDKDVTAEKKKKPGHGKKKNQLFRSRAAQILMVVFTMFMTGMFIAGTVSFFAVPPKARKEAQEIEEMLRRQQEEEEQRRKEREAELARKAAEEEQRRKEEEERRRQEEEYNRQVEEELANNPLLGKYSDASELSVVGVGDSVMLSAVNALYTVFPNGYFDAVFGRTLYDGKNTIRRLEANGTLGDVVVFCLGANSYIEESDIAEINSHCGGRATFWITTYGVSNDSTEKMVRAAEKDEKMFIVDWGSLAKEHEKEYILADGLHPNEAGSAAYAELIRKTINESVLTSHVRKEDGS
jgi:flagellar biosynthesis GTPase FlhF